MPCVGVVVLDGDGRLLVVKRGRPPAQGAWSIPGGRVEPGESLEAAAVREALEETGLSVEIMRPIGRVQLAGADPGVQYDVTDFAATVREPGEVRPGDDADDVRWVTREELAALPTSSGLVDTLERWQVWPAARP